MELKNDDDDREGVVFTALDYEAVRQWVSDRSPQEIIATPTRLYLPIGLDTMVQVDEHDVIWFYFAGGVNAFSVDRH